MRFFITRFPPWVMGVFLLGFVAPINSSAQVCTDDVDCPGDEACIAGWCVAPVPDPVAYAADSGLRQSSYWRMFQLPALFSPAEVCCFDFDGDATIDDAWGSLLASVEPLVGTDFQEEFNALVAGGVLLRITDWTALPDGLADGPTRFSVFDAIQAPGTTVADLAAGTGAALLKTASFGDYGAQDQFNTGSTSGTVAEASGNRFGLTLTFTGGEPMYLPLHQPQVELPLSDDAPGCPGICTVDEIRPGSDPIEVGGGRLGGLIHIEDYLNEMDRQYRQCTCAGVNPDLPVLAWSPNPGSGRYDVACTDPGNWDSTPCSGWCSSLDQFCSLTVGFLPSTTDIDADDDSVLDSWSVGLRVGLVGTTITGTDLLFKDGFESGDRGAWSAAVY